MIEDEIQIESELASEFDLFLDERLYEFNVRATQIDDGQMLLARLEDDTGTLVAGISGTTWGGCCEINRLWVHEDHRARGLGSALLGAAEAEAIRRGCDRVLLFTHSFQAPAFYEALGYERRATIEQYPRGHAKYLYEKRLVDASRAVPIELAVQREAVAAMIERDGKFLVGKRSAKKLVGAGFWCSICGGVETGETRDAAVVREVLEETGLSVAAVEEFAACDTRDGSTRIHFWVAVPLDRAEPRLLGDEHDELRWVSLEEMRQLAPVFEEDVEIFARLVERSKVV